MQSLQTEVNILKKTETGGPAPEQQFLIVRQQTQAPQTNLKEITEMSQISPADEMSQQIGRIGGKGVDELMLA